ncbi:hypothetical protein QQM39_12340 [Streptomyces sp. DT2A-34]|uniref:hypothetical protein n=1 Tax=Streptomyces sp. DT2A-34 TaxID=3051182 RepID=UPI00265BB672|nr:hypothetical protein [Streptomyces sp. DT2A-34]MDO0911608.1 hypothetical protein [Streptomyces sp. DT2A-34]
MPPWPYRAELYDGQDPTDFLMGVLVPSADYWPRVREVLDRHGILHTVGAAGSSPAAARQWRPPARSASPGRPASCDA